METGHAALVIVFLGPHSLGPFIHGVEDGVSTHIRRPSVPLVPPRASVTTSSRNRNTGPRRGDPLRLLEGTLFDWRILIHFCY